MNTLTPAQIRLLRDLLLAALVVIGLIILLVVYLSNTSRKEYSEVIIAQSSEKVSSEFTSRLEPFNKSLNILQKWGQSELPTSEKALSLKTELLNNRLIPILENLGHQSFFHLATSLGTEYLLYRKDRHWLTRSVNIAEWGARQRWQRWKLSGELVEDWWTEESYDPRKEFWYLKASSADSAQPVWNEPQKHPIEQQPSITGSSHWRHGETLFVVAFDIPLREIHRTISQLKPTANGLSFIVTNDGRVLSPLSQVTTPTESSQFFVPPSQVTNQVITAAASTWQQQTAPPDEPYFFSVDNKGWWAGFKPLGDKEQPPFWMGIAIPESDFLGDVSQRRTLLSIVLALLVIAGGLLILQIVRRHSKQLQQAIYDASQLAEKLPGLIAEGENYRQEFKSTMRHNLREDKPDKGIEMAFLKTVVAFLNSEGGTLFVGVADDGEILGLAADNFANEDKCRLHFKNLLNQHIGLEYSRYIHLELITHAEKQLAVVQCEKSRTPVFLKTKNDEEFYIRSGPSSTKLTGSKLLKYLEQRKQAKG